MIFYYAVTIKIEFSTTTICWSGLLLKRTCNMHLLICSAWSNQSFWQSSAENNFTVPKEGGNVLIPSGIVFISKSF